MRFTILSGATRRRVLFGSLALGAAGLAWPLAAQTTPDLDKPSGDASTNQVVELAAKPVAILTGQSTWDNGFKTIGDQFSLIRSELAKANVKATGHPLAVFTDTDDAGFKFQAMVPIDAAGTSAKLGSNVTIGTSPAGRSMKFQHRGAYDDIDSTYEAITAYLDEKGLEAKNLFIEEYLKDLTTSDDTGLEVDIYVFLK